MSEESKPRSGQKRRSQGEGNIILRSDGRWMARISLGSAGGKRRYKAVYGATQKEVRDKLLRLRQDTQKGLPVPSERLRLEDFLTRWLKESVAHSVRTSTSDSYERMVRLHVVPHIGRKVLARVSPQDITGLYATLLGQGLSARTVEYVHAVLHRALKQAARWGLIGHNPVDLVDAPRKPLKEMSPLTLPQMRTLLETADGDRFFAMYILAITAGLREGELLGLQWPDLDWDACSVQVRRQLVRDSIGLRLAEVKTAKGRRTVTLPEVAMQALRSHRAQQNEERLALGPVWTDLDLVFPNTIGKLYERQNFLRQTWKPLLQKAGLPIIRFHDLRHSNATLLLSLDVHPKVVQSRLGHSNISVTMDTYSHVLPELQKDVAAKLDGVFRRSR